MNILMTYMAATMISLPGADASSAEFCDGFSQGYTEVYVQATATLVTAPVCPSQPAKDFASQTDYSQGQQIGATHGLTDAYQS